MSKSSKTIRWPKLTESKWLRTLIRCPQLKSDSVASENKYSGLFSPENGRRHEIDPFLAAHDKRGSKVFNQTSSTFKQTFEFTKVTKFFYTGKLHSCYLSVSANPLLEKVCVQWDWNTKEMYMNVSWDLTVKSTFKSLQGFTQVFVSLRK